MPKHGTAYTLGQYNEVLTGLIRALPKALNGIDHKNLINVISKNGELLEKKLNEIFIELASSPQYPISVDYSRSVKEAVELGKFDWVNDNIDDQNFKTEKKGKVDLTIESLHFGRSMSSEEVFKEIEKNNYRPAELHELLALGEKYPDLQRKFPIAALGSVWRLPFGNRSVPYLDRVDSERDLLLKCLENDWNDDWRFAVVRK